MKAIFITGTDTSIGKTFISSLLLREFNSFNLKTFAIKPIASGCLQYDDGTLKNDDALCLQKHSSIKKPYQIINPIALKEPIAPHIAAYKSNINLTKSNVKNAILSSIQTDADVNIIEGIGGWSVPINDQELFSNVINELDIPVILVIGIKLGCLNHALLTYKNLLSMETKFIGWIANCLSPDMLAINENIDSLQNWIKHPCLGIVPYQCQSLGHINARAIYQSLL